MVGRDDSVPVEFGSRLYFQNCFHFTRNGLGGISCLWQMILCGRNANSLTMELAKLQLEVGIKMFLFISCIAFPDIVWESPTQNFAVP
ncbi:1-acyl-sn-glycerol-3-phosphate acyltransferase 1, chloroplastic [Gossypium australe]|uniref:1-acyl-sn-glycerol-3-phosphate acyltransferase 1, chloroplastic n=1 Tax=Gossypium australe TaxID=47621 RepID=A0A5B6X7R4_9ROSI|nr:1-acyl-sn-glycerol-3-phosphate acyltransferase 1, chloroplastic [Gossypium australe]